MHQLGARLYWPEVGRLFQQHPVRDGMNQYAYGGENPVVWVDPEGLHYVDLSGPIGIPGFGFIGGVQIGPDPCDPRPFWHRVHPYGGLRAMAGLPLGATPGAFAGTYWVY
jgi:hypothetical protein